MAFWDQLQRFTRRGRELARARRKAVAGVLALAGLAMLWWYHASPLRGPDTLLVVSYDVTREFFQAVGAEFGGDTGLSVRVSHSGSVQQARNMARGLVADVVNFAAAADVGEVVSRSGAIHSGWAERLPYRSSPYTSTIVFVVRAGNPLGIRDWDDLWRPEVRVAAPDPRVSGAGRTAYLAAHAAAGDRLDAAALHARMQWLALGARQALEVFRREGTADVFLTWESEGLRLAGAAGSGLEMVPPPFSILAEPVVALVDAHVDRRGTRAAATRLLEFLFAPEGQAIAARNGLRPRLEEAAKHAPAPFPPIRLLTVDEAFGGADAAWERHFGDDGTLARVLLLRAARHGGVE